MERVPWNPLLALNPAHQSALLDCIKRGAAPRQDVHTQKVCWSVLTPPELRVYHYGTCRGAFHQFCILSLLPQKSFSTLQSRRWLKGRLDLPALVLYVGKREVTLALTWTVEAVKRDPCPSKDILTCAWRGSSQFCNEKCYDGEVELTTSPLGQVQHKALAASKENRKRLFLNVNEKATLLFSQRYLAKLRVPLVKRRLQRVNMGLAGAA